MHSTNAKALRLEKEWHNRLYSQSPPTVAIPMPVLERYTQLRFGALFHLERMVEIAGSVSGKRILCYGCGDSNIPTIFALRGAAVWAIDVSEEAIATQNEIAAANGASGRVTGIVSAAESLPFSSGFFDIVFGSMILHHLPDALELAAKEVHRVLKRSGLAIFGEPVIRSHALALMRRLFPKRDISPRERQLTDSDFAAFVPYFALTVEDFYILSRFNQFIARGPLEFTRRARRIFIMLIARIDRVLLKVRGLRRFASTVVVSMRPI